MSDTAGERPGVDIISQHSQQIGGVNVTFTVGRINPIKTRSRNHQPNTGTDQQPKHPQQTPTQSK